MTKHVNIWQVTGLDMLYLREQMTKLFMTYAIACHQWNTEKISMQQLDFSALDLREPVASEFRRESIGIGMVGSPT